MREEYTRIALAMNSFNVGELISITALAKKADVHYNTAKKAIYFFKAIQELDMPKVTQTPRGKFILSRDSERKETEG